VVLGERREICRTFLCSAGIYKVYLLTSEIFKDISLFGFHLTIRLRGNIATITLGAEIQSRSTGLLPGDSVAAEKILLAGDFTGHIS